MRKISQMDQVDAAQSGLSVSYPERHSSTSGFKSHQTAGILSFRLQNRPGYVKKMSLWRCGCDTNAILLWRRPNGDV